MSTTVSITEALSSKFKIVHSHSEHGQETVVLEKDQLHSAMQFLRDDPQMHFEMMIDLSAVDFYPQPKFEVVYHLKSLQHGHRLRVKVELSREAAVIDSIHDLYACADWYERECSEMYGIKFNNHPNPKFLLLYDGFRGYPLRKDYDKFVMQPLVPMRTVVEDRDYGEKFYPVDEQKDD